MKILDLFYFTIGDHNLNIPMAWSPWHRKGGPQLDSKLSGGPRSLKMESGYECTVCAITKCFLITALMSLGSEFFDWCVHGLSRYYTQEPDRHLWQPGTVLGIFGWVNNFAEETYKFNFLSYIGIFYNIIFAPLYFALYIWRSGEIWQDLMRSFDFYTQLTSARM